MGGYASFCQIGPGKLAGLCGGILRSHRGLFMRSKRETYRYEIGVIRVQLRDLKNGSEPLAIAKDS